MVDQVARATSRSIYGAQGVRRGSRPISVARDQLGSYSAWARRHRALSGRRAPALVRRTILYFGEFVDIAHLEPEWRMILAFEELVLTSVNLGQMLSTREDLLPSSWTIELALLHSQVAPVPFDELLPQVAKRSGIHPLRFSASRARTLRGGLYRAGPPCQARERHSGDPEIRWPGIEVKIDADLRLLAQLADLVEREMQEARAYRPVEVVGQLRRSLDRELDLSVEARHTERFARNFAGDPNILVPHVYPEWTSSVMNVQEHIDGIRSDDLGAIVAAGLDRKLLAARGADAVLKIILVDGFFHADPYPGNVMYLLGNRIALIDFGMAGRLSVARRNQLLNLLTGIARHDEEAMLEVLLDWRGDDVVDEARLANDLGELAFDFADMQLKDLKVGVLLHRVSAVLREHAIVMLADLALLFKALISLEGLAVSTIRSFACLTVSSRS